MTTFSVIMATYNRGRHIIPSIKSVLGQTFQDFELLVVGDACTDDTERHVTSLQSDKITWVNNARRSGSQSGPNNAGIKSARGKYIAYLGHDDIWSPNHLEVLHEVHTDLQPDFLFSAIVLHPAPGLPLEYYGSGCEPKGLVKQPYFVPPTGTSHLKDAVQGLDWAQPYEIRYPVDVDFQKRAHEKGLKFAATGRATAHKFIAATRYLSYADPSSDEQQDLLDSLRNGTVDPTILAANTDMRHLKTSGPTTFRSQVKSPGGKHVDRLYAFKGLTPKPTALGFARTVPMMSEARGSDWVKKSALPAWLRFFRLSGPNPRPRLLIPYTSEKPVRMHIPVLASSLEQIKALEMQVNGEKQDFKIGVRWRRSRFAFAILSLRTPLKAGASSVLRIVQDDALKLARPQGRFEFVAVGSIFLRR